MSVIDVRNLTFVSMRNVDQLRKLFLQYLEENRFKQSPEELYEPINYILDIGGKRMRPVMLLLACQMFTDDAEQALPAALAVEIFHNFTLLHDDIMDDAQLRRSKPTVHEKYDTNTAILSGDVMMIYSYHYLSKLPESLIPNLLNIMNRVAIGVCEGQQYDMNFETSETVTIPEYLKMIEYKTAVLLAGSMQMGALVGGADERDAQHTADFGRDIGIAFQLQDDILDTFGDPAKFGKKVGGDIIQNKKTFLVLKTLELANFADAENLRALMQTHPADPSHKIQQVKALFEQYDIRNIAEKEMDTYLAAALSHLDAVRVNDDRKRDIRELARYLIKREV